MADLNGCDRQTNRIFLTSGWTTTYQSSTDPNVGGDYRGIGWDGADTLLCGENNDKLYRMDGQFTTTINDSTSTTSESAVPQGLASDATTSYDTVWCGQYGKIYKALGSFSGAINSSSSTLGGVVTNPTGVSTDGTDLWITDDQDDKVWVSDGWGTSINNSTSVVGIATSASGVCWDGADTLWCCQGSPYKMYKLTGKAGTTIQSSVVGIDYNLFGVSTDDYSSRLGSGSGTSVPVIVHHLKQQGIA